jgi:hypothetical protein
MSELDEVKVEGSTDILLTNKATVMQLMLPPISGLVKNMHKSLAGKYVGGDSDVVTSTLGAVAASGVTTVVGYWVFPKTNTDMETS